MLKVFDFVKQNTSLIVKDECLSRTVNEVEQFYNFTYMEDGGLSDNRYHRSAYQF